jgi:glucose/arabinose dehydrogenase
MRPPHRLTAVIAAVVLTTACVGGPGAREGESTDIPFGDATGTSPPTASPPDPAQVNPGPTVPAPAEPDAARDAPQADVALEATTVAENLVAPWDVVFADDRVFVTERDSGRILELAHDGSTTELLALDIDSTGEGGLLGLVADPAADGLRFYAFLTGAQDNRIVRIAPGGEPEPVLTGIPKARVHNGGRIAFGPDGMLYAATGDAGDPTLAQDASSLAGKILRLTPDGAVPADNPDPDSPVYASGIRNPQGLAWTADGTLYSSSFGPEVDDEVNRIEPGGNYGWPEVTGRAGDDRFVDPVFVRQPDVASWSGLAALVDGAIPQWEGDLFVAALRGQRLWRLELGSDGAVEGQEELFVGELGRLRQVVQAPDGSLWVLTSNRDGRGQPAEADDRIVRIGPAA